MNRYDRIPAPTCHHARRGIVSAGDGSPGGGAHAATNVCDRAECIADAMEWARMKTHREPTHRRDADRVSVVAPSLFDALAGSARKQRNDAAK